MSDPVLRITKGDPTPEELAALLAVVTARSTAAPATAGPATDRASNWATYWRNHTRPLHPGPGRWKASAHP